MKSKESAQRRGVAALVMLALTALFVSACGSKTENANNQAGNQAGTLKKALNAADEAAALRTLQTIYRAETEYMTGHDGEYGTFDQLVKSLSLDQRFAGSAPVVEGYVFALTLKPDASGKATDYSINADPKEEPSGGARHLYMDASSNVVRANAKQKASVSDPPLQ